MNGISVVYLEGFTESIYTVYTGDKPKPNVNSDAQIFLVAEVARAASAAGIRMVVW